MTSQQIEALLDQTRQTVELIVKGQDPDPDPKTMMLALMLAPLHEIAYQLAVHNEREAERVKPTMGTFRPAEGFMPPLTTPHRYQGTLGGYCELCGDWLGAPLHAPSSANAQPTAQEPTPEAKPKPGEMFTFTIIDAEKKP